MLTFGSLFSGIGGFDLGFERAGMRSAWQVECDPNCQSVLARHWPDVAALEDVRHVTARTVPAIDLVCGGFPCQDLSVAGRRAGLAGARSGLWWEFHRILGAFRPRWLVIENVPGLLSSNGGGDMGALLWSLGKLGYRWAFRVLDAQYFGVAQRRRRVFIVGHLGAGHRAAEVLFDGASLQRHPPSRREAGARVAPLLAGGAGGRGSCVGADEAAGGQIIADPISASEGKTHTHEGRENFRTHNVVFSKAQKAHHAEDCERWEPADSSLTLDAAGHAPRTATAVLAFTERGRAEGRTLEVSEETAYALMNPGKGGRAHEREILAGSPRRLTPRECERLQGFPDDWTRLDHEDREIADSPRYRMLGNAVAVPVAQWIGRRILESELGGFR